MTIQEFSPLPVRKCLITVRKYAIAAICCGFATVCLWADLARAQQASTAPSDSAQAKKSASSTDEFNSFTNLPARNLAPGVLITVPPNQNTGDMTIGPIDLDFVAAHPELEWGPPTFPEGKPNTFPKSDTLLELGRDVTLRHPIWALEFSYKPLRLIKAQVPTPQGTLEDQLVWYLIYRVRYTGSDLLPNQEAMKGGTGIPLEPKRVVYKSVRFLPRFTLVSPEYGVQYDSQILSTTKSAIASRERVGKPLLDFMEMSAQEISPVSDAADNSVWGIATWTGIDPRIDAFYVDIRGLTNAFQREVDSKNQEVYRRKTLRLYFWKPGDTIAQTEDRISVGVPAFESPERQQQILNLFKIQERLDYSWVYR